MDDLFLGALLAADAVAIFIMTFTVLSAVLGGKV